MERNIMLDEIPMTDIKTNSNEEKKTSMHDQTRNIYIHIFFYNQIKPISRILKCRFILSCSDF